MLFGRGAGAYFFRVFMHWNDFLAGIALYLVLEGILPFLSPESWRRSITMVAGLPLRQLQIFGLVSMLAGLVLLAVVRGGS